MDSLIQFEVEQGVAVVTINNPPMNVLSHQVSQELLSAFKTLASDETVIVIVLTGAGEKAFMAGADIKEFPQLITKNREEILQHNKGTVEAIRYLATIPKPTIAMLNGYTFGGGCELALACDIRIAEIGTQIGLPEVKLGIFPGGGGTQRLPRLIGSAKAKELMFIGEPVAAEEALQLNLVNQVVQKGEGLLAAKKMAAQIASRSIQALSRIKASVDDGLNETLEAGLNTEAQHFADIFATEDAKEGVNAFIEKRTPTFKNK